MQDRVGGGKGYAQLLKSASADLLRKSITSPKDEHGPSGVFAILSTSLGQFQMTTQDRSPNYQKRLGKWRKGRMGSWTLEKVKFPGESLRIVSSKSTTSRVYVLNRAVDNSSLDHVSWGSRDLETGVWAKATDAWNLVQRFPLDRLYCLIYWGPKLERCPVRWARQMILYPRQLWMCHNLRSCKQSQLIPSRS